MTSIKLLNYLPSQNNQAMCLMKDVTKKDETELKVFSSDISEKHGNLEAPGSWSELIKKKLLFICIICNAIDWLTDQLVEGAAQTIVRFS